MSYLITVIIPAYNAEKYIDSAIESIKNQTIGFENIELIIVDDASTDSTIEILKGYEKNFPNIKCFYQNENTGTPSNGRNIGIDNASSKYVMFLDLDDRYHHSMCEVMYNTIEKYNTNFVMCNHKTILNGDFSDFEKFEQDKTSLIQCDPKENEHILLDSVMWNKIYKTNFLRRYDIKCPVNCYCEDAVFSIKAILNCDEIVYLTKYQGILYNIRDEEGNFSASNRFNSDVFSRLFKGYVNAIDEFKKANREDLIDSWMKRHFTNFLSSFIRLDAEYSEKINFLKDICEFKKYANFNGKLEEKWAEIINKNLDKENYNFIIFYSDIIFKLYSMTILKSIYRSRYNKLT